MTKLDEQCLFFNCIFFIKKRGKREREKQDPALASNVNQEKLSFIVDRYVAKLRCELCYGIIMLHARLIRLCKGWAMTSIVVDHDSVERRCKKSP